MDKLEKIKAFIINSKETFLCNKNEHQIITKFDLFLERKKNVTDKINKLYELFIERQ